MDELYAIHAVKTEFRDGFNVADVSRLLAIADPDFVSFSDSQPSEFGQSELGALKTRLEDLFRRFTARLAVIHGCLSRNLLIPESHTLKQDSWLLENDGKCRWIS